MPLGGGYRHASLGGKEGGLLGRLNFGYKKFALLESRVRTLGGPKNAECEMSGALSGLGCQGQDEW